MKKRVAGLAAVILLAAFTAEAGWIIPEEAPEGRWSCGWYTVQIQGNRMYLFHDNELLQETEFRIQDGRIIPDFDWFCDRHSLCEFSLYYQKDCLVLEKRSVVEGIRFFLLKRETA